MSDTSITVTEPLIGAHATIKPDRTGKDIVSRETMSKPGTAHDATLIDRIISLALSGPTRAAIAAQVGMTRSQVCGHLWRRGVAPVVKKAKRVEAKTSTKPRRKPADRNMSSTTDLKNVASDTFGNTTSTAHLKTNKMLHLNCETKAPGVSWDDLQPHHCRWPTSEGLWCGEPSRPRLSHRGRNAR